MAKFHGIIILLSFFCGGVLGSINEPISKHFKTFSYNLLLESDLDEFSIEKGAAISSPFGVGYMLANINERVWNVSNDGLDVVLNSPKEKIAEEYQTLLDVLQKGQMSTSSTLYTKEHNITSSFPVGSQKMKTETKFVDFLEDWKTTWLTMNSMIANQTNGRLDDQLIPKGGWWGGAFYHFTMGAFINTNHYKSDWTTPWKSIGPKQFHDGLTVPFYEADGTVPYLETAGYTAIAISLKEGKKTVVFVLPKIKLVEFLKLEMPKLVQSGSPQAWNSTKAKKVQFPGLNITLLDQHYKKLEALGVNYTFCVDEPSSLDVEKHKGSYFMGPVVQSHHIQFTPEFFEVASATGASLNSEDKMREAQYEFGGPLPSSPNSGEQVADGSEFVLPVEMDETLAKALADGTLHVDKVDVILADKDNNDTITAASTSSVEEVVAAPSDIVTINASSLPYPNVASTVGTPIPVEKSTTTTAVPSTPAVPTFVSEPLDENTIRFDKPFFWYLYDEDMGPLYYGTVNSIATYQKEYGIETDEDLWLYDAYKTLLWNCP